MDDDLAARRARHQPEAVGYGDIAPVCGVCSHADGNYIHDEPWPCDAAVLGAELEETQAAADMMDAELMDRRRACDAFRTALEQERQARQAAEARAERHRAALGEIVRFPVETPIAPRAGWPNPPPTPQAVARQALAEEADGKVDGPSDSDEGGARA